MKNLFFAGLLAVAAFIISPSCGNSKNGGEHGMVKGDSSTVKINAGDTTTWTEIQWIDSVFDFGTLDAGPVVAASFRFKNTGSKPLVIESVTAGCGCTEPEKPADPIMPGQEGVVKAKFKSENQMGAVQKNITVSANAPARNYTLYIKGTVNPKK
jgi:Protein of unknown function (DUF1573)